MHLFYSFNVDMIFACCGMALLIYGVLMLGLSRVEMDAADLRNNRLLGTGFILLGLREWVTYLSIGAVDRVYFDIGNILLLTLAAAAIAGSGWQLGRPGAWRRFIALLTAYGVLLVLYFLSVGVLRNEYGPAYNSIFVLFVCQAAVFVPAVVYYAAALSGEKTVFTAAFFRAHGLYLLFAALLALGPIPAVTPALAGQSGLLEVIGPVVHFIRMLTAFAMAILLWRRFGLALGVTGPSIWLPVVMLLVLMMATFVFVNFRTWSFYRGNQQRHLKIADAYAELLDPERLARVVAAGENAGADASEYLFGHAQRAARRFSDVFGSPLYFGVVAPAPGHDGYYLITPSSDPVEPWDEPSGEAAAVLGGGKAGITNAWGSSSRPINAFSPILDANGAAVGAAMVGITADNWIRELVAFKRLAILFVFGVFIILTVFLRGQFVAWLASRASGMTKAWRDGVLGHGLVGVVMTDSFMVTDANAHFLDMRGLDYSEITGMTAREAFCLDAEDNLTAFADIVEKLRHKDETQLECDFPGRLGKAMRVLVLVRTIAGSDGKRHVWECVDITRQKEMALSLRESRDFLQVVLDAMPVPILVKNYAGVFLLANQAFASMYDTEPRQIVGKRDQDLLDRDAAFLSRQQDAAARNLSIRGESFVGELGLTTNGVSKRYEVFRTAKRVGAEGNGIVIVALHDLTVRLRFEDEINQERHFLGQVLNVLPTMVCFIDPNGIVRLADASFCAEVGKTFDRIVGRPYSEISVFPSDDTAIDRRMLAMNEKFRENDIEMVKADGGIRNLILRRSLLVSPRGKILGLVKAFWDTTQLVEATRAAEAANRAKTAFLANMSHEIRTPLNGIVGMADIILGHEAATPEMRLSAETIINSSRALQSVLDEVMDFATHEEDALVVNSAPFDLRRLVEEAMRIESTVAESMGIPIELLMTSSLEPGARGDARRLRQILIQTLSTCCRWADSAGVRMTVRGSRRVEGGRDVGFSIVFTPRTGADIDAIRKLINDSAAVRAPDAVPERFDPPMLRNLVEKMGGTLEIVEARETPGAAACNLVLPLPEDASVKIAKEMPDLTGLRVLVACRNQWRTDAVLDYLAGAGATCVTVDNPEEMFKRLRSTYEAGKDPYHILLADSLFMPRDRAEEVLRDVKTSTHFGSPRIIVIASTRDLTLGLGGNERIVDAFLPHPLLPSDLWTKVGKQWDDIIATLPRLNDTDAMRQRRSNTVEAKRSKTTGLKIKAKALLVEDNPVNQMVAKGILNRIGCQTVTSKNGLEAVDRIKSGETYDIILMDCMMPVMNGYDATKNIRLYEKANPDAKRHTIVALTANALPGDREKCLAAGMDGYMTKPVTQEMMRDNLIRYCPNASVIDANGNTVRPEEPE